MFYQSRNIEDNLICPRCHEKFVDPKVMECGDSLCGICILDLQETNPDIYQCPVCFEEYSILGKVFPPNKDLIKLLNIQPVAVEQSLQVKLFNNKLDLISEVRSDYNNAWEDNGIEMVNNFCNNTKNSIDVECELKKNKIDEEREALFQQVDSYETDTLGFFLIIFKKILVIFIKIFFSILNFLILFFLFFLRNYGRQ
jgi:hypothetical protein